MKMVVTRNTLLDKNLKPESALTQYHPMLTVTEILSAFGADFLDDEFCRLWILKKLHPGTEHLCPQCRTPITGSTLQHFWEAKRIRCGACGKFFTALSGTIISGCHLDFRSLIILGVFLGLGIRYGLIAAKLGINQETVRLWQKKFEAIEKLSRCEYQDDGQSSDSAVPFARNLHGTAGSDASFPGQGILKGVERAAAKGRGGGRKKTVLRS
jgi:transposase-like protein